MTTLAQLRTRARERADMVNSQFIDDSELTTHLNMGLFELYDLVVNAYEDYFTREELLSVPQGDDSVALPVDFYKLRALDYKSGTRWLPCREFNLSERNHSESAYAERVYGSGVRSYRIMGDRLYIKNEAKSGGDYKLWYVPSLSPLVNTTDAIPSSLSMAGWDQYPVLYAAELMLAKEESSVVDVVREKDALAQRIKKMAADRKVDQSATIQDVQGIQNNIYGGCW